MSSHRFASIPFALLAALLATPLFAQASTSPAPTGRQALREARALADQIKGSRGPERNAALEVAARSFMQVAETFQAEVGVAAEASFEAGELWRRRGTLADAEPCYRKALSLDPTRYEARASFEIAHIARRTKRYDEACELYGKVAGLQPTSARAQSAREWIGRTYQTAGRGPEALTAFRVALDQASNPGAVISAADWLVKAQVGVGDLTAARTTLAEIEARLAKDAEGDSPAAERVRDALAGMSSRRMLQRASDKKSDAAGDAIDIEGSGTEGGGTEGSGTGGSGTGGSGGGRTGGAGRGTRRGK